MKHQKTLSLSSLSSLSLLLLSLSLTLIPQTQANDEYQAIWVESYNYDSAKNFDYLTLKLKFYSTETSFDNQLPPKNPVSGLVGDYFALYKRKHNDANVKKMFKYNLISYDLFSFYFPATNTAYLPKPYVVWKFKFDCAGFMTFNLKVFNCYAQAKDFVTNAADNLGTIANWLIFDPSEGSTGDFKSADSVYSPGSCSFGGSDFTGIVSRFKNTAVSTIGCTAECTVN